MPVWAIVVLLVTLAILWTLLLAAYFQGHRELERLRRLEQWHARREQGRSE